MVQLARSFSLLAALLAMSGAVARPLSDNNVVKRQDNGGVPNGTPTGLTGIPPSGTPPLGNNGQPPSGTPPPPTGAPTGVPNGTQGVGGIDRASGVPPTNGAVPTGRTNGNSANFGKRQDDSESASVTDSALPTDVSTDAPTDASTDVPTDVASNVPTDVPSDASSTLAQPTGSDFPIASDSAFPSGDPSATGLPPPPVSLLPSGSDFSDFPQPSGVQGDGQPPFGFCAPAPNGTDPSFAPSGDFSDIPVPTDSISLDAPTGTPEPSDSDDALINSPTESATDSASV